MHPINKVLSLLSLKISVNKRPPQKFMAEYRYQLSRLVKNNRGFEVFKNINYEVGDHPANHMDYECAFAAAHISGINPVKILDIGSYRQFIIGMLGHFGITTIDIRERPPISNKEIVVTGDAKKLKGLRVSEWVKNDVLSI